MSHFKIFLGIITVILIIGAASIVFQDELDTICDTPDSLLFRSTNGWGCGILKGDNITINYNGTINFESNDTLQSVTDRGAVTTNDIYIIGSDSVGNVAQITQNINILGSTGNLLRSGNISNLNTYKELNQVVYGDETSGNIAGYNKNKTSRQWSVNSHMVLDTLSTSSTLYDIVLAPQGEVNSVSPVKINEEMNDLAGNYFSVWGNNLSALPREELIYVSDYGVTLMRNEEIRTYNTERAVQIGSGLGLHSSRPSMTYNHYSPDGAGGAVWNIVQATVTDKTDGETMKVAELGVLAGETPSTGYLFLSAQSDGSYIRNAMRIHDARTIDFNPSQVTSAQPEDAWVQIYGTGGGKSYFALTSEYITGNANKGDILIVQENGNVGIGEQTPTYPLEVGSNVSGISAWFQADVSATGYITRTYETDLTDKQAHNLVQYALNNEYDAQGNYNHQAWAECYAPHEIDDKTKPIYKNVTKTEYIGEEDNLEEVNITYQKITGYEKKIVGGVNIDCKQVMISKAQNHLTKEFDGGIAMFDAIYTKSKYPQPNINYASDFKIEELDKKETHYATTIKNGQQVLDMEERIMRLEGAIAQIVSETCLDSKKYSWCQ